MVRSTGLVLLGALLASAPASAQSTAAPAAPPPVAPAPAGSLGSTVDGGLPARAGATSAVGRTKPPGSTAPGTRPDLEEKSRRLGERISKGICTGCK